MNVVTWASLDVLTEIWTHRACSQHDAEVSGGASLLDKHHIKSFVLVQLSILKGSLRIGQTQRQERQTTQGLERQFTWEEKQKKTTWCAQENGINPFEEEKKTNIYSL